jgi:hypothetical protein
MGKVRSFVIERLNLLGGPFIQIRRGDYPKRWDLMMFESILCQVTEYDPEVLESLIGLAVEIAR